MRYHVSASDDDLASRYEERLAAAGYETLDAYSDDAVLVSVGGDGAILYNAWTHDEPTILPVAKPGSEANTIQLDADSFLDGVAALEEGREGVDYRVERHRRLTATRDGEELRGDFRALNEVSLHHGSPGRAAEFRVRVEDGDTVYAIDRAIGDGVVVATPFGATGYYRSITHTGFEEGIGVGFNNLHKPADALEGLVVSASGRVEVEPLEAARPGSAILVRDNDPDAYELRAGEPVEIRLSGGRVELIRFDSLAPDWRRY